MLPNEKHNFSRFNVKVRNRDYISPEQTTLSMEMEELLVPKNGRIIPDAKSNQ